MKMDYVAFEVTITAVVRGEGPNGVVDRPSAIAYVDVSSGRPILLREGKTGAPGVSTTEAWSGLNLDQVVAALPGVSAEEPPSIEAGHVERRRCPGCGRKVEMHENGQLVRHNDKPEGGVPCKQGVVPGRRNKWPAAPPNVLYLFEKKYNKSYIELGKAYRVPTKVANNWVQAALKKAAKQAAAQAGLAALPIRDPKSGVSLQRAPQNILEIFVKQFNSKYNELCAVYDISRETAYYWVNHARRKEREQLRREERERRFASRSRSPEPEPEPAVNAKEEDDA